MAMNASSRFLSILPVISLLGVGWVGAEEPGVRAPEGWATLAPREEIKPAFRYDARGGRSGKGALVIAGDEREGTTGLWTKTFDVQGGKTYQFCAWRKAENVASPRRSGVARVLWRDAKVQLVQHAE